MTMAYKLKEFKMLNIFYINWMSIIYFIFDCVEELCK